MARSQARRGPKRPAKKAGPKAGGPSRPRSKKSGGRRQDAYGKQARREGYAARSVYKLEEIDRRFRLFAKGDRVVDLGAAPGSWLQYLARAVGPKGAVAAYDLEPCTVGAPGPVESFVRDVEVLEGEEIREALGKISGAETETPPLADGLVSDMAPKLTGIRDSDQAKSVALAERALELANAVVKPTGFFVAKFFQGRDTDEFLLAVKRRYAQVRLIKPEATRQGSREVFVVAQRKRAVPLER